MASEQSEGWPRPHPIRTEGMAPASVGAPFSANERQRDALPLSIPSARSDNDVSHLSRSVLRRALRRKHEHGWASEAASALNEIGGFTTSPTAASVPRVWKLASDWVETAVHTMGLPPEGLDGREAFRELQAKHSYAGEAVHVAPLDISLLSLPGSSRPQELSSLLERGADEVQALVASSVSPKEQAAARMSEENIPRRPYLDPVLHQPRRYEELLRAMESCGMIEWALACEEQVGRSFLCVEDVRQAALDRRRPSEQRTL